MFNVSGDVLVKGVEEGRVASSSHTSASSSRVKGVRGVACPTWLKRSHVRENKDHKLKERGGVYLIINASK
jgi:hypothetical protein